MYYTKVLHFKNLFIFIRTILFGEIKRQLTHYIVYFQNCFFFHQKILVFIRNTAIFKPIPLYCNYIIIKEFNYINISNLLLF